MNRKEICQHVGELIIGERNATHGDPFAQFETATSLKNIIAGRLKINAAFLTVTELESLQMILTKISRIVNGTPIRDHWDDIIGYAAIAAEARDNQTPKFKPGEIIYETDYRHPNNKK